MSDTEPAPALPADEAVAPQTFSTKEPRSLPPAEAPSGIVVTVYDVPIDQPLERCVSAIDAVRRLGPGKVVVDMGGLGKRLAGALFERGISVQSVDKRAGYDQKGLQTRLLNCRALLERVERGLRQGTLAADEGVRANLLFDIEALAERC